MGAGSIATEGSRNIEASHISCLIQRSRLIHLRISRSVYAGILPCLIYGIRHRNPVTGRPLDTLTVPFGLGVVRKSRFLRSKSQYEFINLRDLHLRFLTCEQCHCRHSNEHNVGKEPFHTHADIRFHPDHIQDHSPHPPYQGCCRAHPQS